MSSPPELTDIVAFLGKHHPFGLLPLNALQHAAKNLEITYMPQNTRIFEVGADNSYLFIVRTGAVDISDEHSVLAERCGEGDFFGFPSVLTEIPTRYTAVTIEDSLVYMMHTSIFHELRREYPEFDQHFVMVHSERLMDTRISQTKDIPHTSQVRHILQHDPITTTPQTTIQVAAQHMRQERISSLLVVEQDRLVGILTDRDIRNRVVAEGLDYNNPVAQVMTKDPITVNSHQQTLEAQMLMTRHNIHHLPVMDNDRIIGLITMTDLMHLQSSSPVRMIGEIAKQNHPDEIANVLSRLPQLIVSLVDADATAYDISHIITQITDAVTRRLLQLAEIRLGPAPIPYAWLAFGSQARQEQTAKTDQDNGLLLAEKPSPDTVTYFQELATFVCDGLAICGYEYCPGGVMATNWCYDLDEWQAKFTRWIDKPEPDALLNVSIFFDMRPIYGDNALATILEQTILEKAQGNMVFLGSMAKNALGFHPPLGFFRRFVLEKGGEHHHTLDLKHRGVTPIIDMVRVYSLAYGIRAINTTDRIQALVPTPGIAPEDGANLRDALEFMAHLRLGHQSQQIASGATADNFVDPDSLSSFERQHLQTAFKIVGRMQNTLSQRYLTSFIS